MFNNTYKPYIVYSDMFGAKNVWDKSEKKAIKQVLNTLYPDTKFNMQKLNEQNPNKVFGAIIISCKEDGRGRVFSNYLCKIVNNF